jgi:hypothetical protein
MIYFNRYFGLVQRLMPYWWSCSWQAWFASELLLRHLGECRGFWHMKVAFVKSKRRERGGCTVSLILALPDHHNDGFDTIRSNCISHCSLGFWRFSSFSRLMDGVTKWCAPLLTHTSAGHHFRMQRPSAQRSCVGLPSLFFHIPDSDSLLRQQRVDGVQLKNTSFPSGLHTC